MTDIDVEIPGDESAAAAVSAGPVVMGDDGESYERLVDGRIRFEFGSKSYVLRRPRLGEYRSFRGLFLDLVRSNARARDLASNSTSDVSEQEAAEDESFDVTVKFITEVFEALSDRKLPEDTGEWPVWLVAGISYGDWLAHWRSVPLARGATAQA